MRHTKVMSATVENPFKAVHRGYKHLNRVKALVRLKSNTHADIIDIFEVYSYRLKELLATIESQCANESHSEATQIRLAALKLALLYDHLDVLMYSTSLVSKGSLVPPTSVAIINAELDKTIQCMQTYHPFRFNEMLSLVYLKLYNLLAKIAFHSLKNVPIARQLIDTVQRMYIEMLEQHNEHPRNYYGWRELFAKSSQLKPSAAACQFDAIEKLFAESASLLAKIEQFEDDRNGAMSNVGGDGEDDTDFRSVFDAAQDPAILLGKLLSIIPMVQTQRQWKTSAYLLLVAQQLAVGSSVKQASPMVDIKVRSSIITSWMRYIFGVFNESAVNWEQLCNGVGKLRLSQKFGQKMPNIAVTESNFHEIFNFYADTIPLPADELQFCVDSMQTIADGQRLIEYTLRMMVHLLNDSDFHSFPMEFIIHHYQMSDVLSIATIFAPDQYRCFDYQLERFHNFMRMMQALEKYCPQMHATLAPNLLDDLNEIILDLYAINCDRCVNIASQHDADDDITDGSRTKNTNQMQMNDHQRQIIAKLNELHAMTQPSQ